MPITPRNDEMYENIPERERVQRKTLITVAGWTEDGTEVREVLGARTEDSAIEFNPDIETTTDILGVTYTDVNKTEPQQDFDPYMLLKNSKLGAYLSEAVLNNKIDKFSNCFDIYVITAFLGSEGAFECVKHTGCSIIPRSMGGDTYVSMPIEVHFSNEITKGTVDKLADDFEFTPASSI